MGASGEAIWRNNLRVIEQLYPPYVEKLQRGGTGAYQFTPGIDGSVLCRQETGPGAERWIHGPENPWETAAKSLASVNWAEQQLFIILRPGLGYLPLTLYPQMRKGRHAQRMLLVEDRISLLAEGLRQFDWSDALRSDRTILLLDADPIAAVMHFFETNPSSMLSRISVLSGSELDGEEQRLLQSLQQQFVPRVEQVFEAAKQYMRDIRAHYTQRQQAGEAQPAKVLFVEPEHDYLAGPMAQGFEAQGCDTAFFQANRRLLNFLNPFIWLVYCREHLPDVLLWMNRNTLSPEGAQTLAEWPVDRVLWFLDSPKRVQTSAEELQATDAVFSFDPTYLPYLEELGGKPAYYLPTAAGIEPMPPCRPGKTWPEREGPPVGFMGALAVQRYQEVLAFWQQRDAEFVAMLDEIVEGYLVDSSETLEQRYLASPASERLPFSGFVVLYLEERVTYLRRYRHLEGLVDLGLKTYGGVEWRNPEWAGPMAGCYTGQTPRYREDLPRVYYHTLVNVNIFHAQCFNAANPRVYDVLAAGGFLITEYRPVLEEEFTLGEHLVTYRDAGELRELTDYYLRHAEEREAIARAGQAHVLANCTYAQRAQRILDVLRGENQRQKDAQEE